MLIHRLSCRLRAFGPKLGALALSALTVICRNHFELDSLSVGGIRKARLQIIHKAEDKARFIWKYCCEHKNRMRSRNRKQKGKEEAFRFPSLEMPKEDICCLNFQLVLLEAMVLKVISKCLHETVDSEFSEVSGLFMAEENTKYVHINFVINGRSGHQR